MEETEIDVAGLAAEARDMNALVPADAATIAPPENKAFQGLKDAVKALFRRAGVIGSPQNDAVQVLEEKHRRRM